MELNIATLKTIHITRFWGCQVETQFLENWVPGKFNHLNFFENLSGTQHCYA